ncbi:MAG: citramalate synthase [Actinomycetota bacterium]|nr:citramalate synthase [Actinomycetota bacterium]
MAMAKVKLYDTTLRDGAQREGLSFTVDDKLKIAQKLDELGIHYIEGGWPGSNPKDIEFFRGIKDYPIRNATIVAFGSTRRKNTLPDEDQNLKALIKAGTPAVCIFGKSWDVHVTSALVTTLEENLKMIFDSVSFLKNRGFEVIYDAEHFFDGYRNNEDYAMKTLKAAVDAGADWIVLCDTNGGTLPLEIREIIRAVKAKIKVPLGIHAHNDADCAVANSIVAVEEGVTQVQGTINGYGERCGNANLVSIIPNLVLKLGIPCLSREKLPLLTEVSHHVSEIANIAPDTHQPYVGQSAFAHKGGVHVSAILRQKGAYEHVDPEVVGNVQRILVSELSGTTTLLQKAKELGIDLMEKKDRMADILKKLKKREHEGYHFEVADGSFALFILKNIGTYRPLFELESFEVGIDRWRTGRFETQAIVKLRVKGKRIVEVAEGNGPINALDRALRRALEPLYPDLSRIKLTDYKVRVLDRRKGTAAVVRVLIESTDGESTWGTVGVSENIIEASWQALVDGIEYGLLRKALKAKS